MKIAFMGSPDFAVPILNEIHAEFGICGVITQPDRPAGRGRELRPPKVKESALKLNLPVLQPEKIGSPTSMQALEAWQPDIIVVAAYGQILPANVLTLPPLGCLNVHASLLPRWRGAAPIQAAILSGDQETGVTIMLMDEGLDTGPILTQEGTPIKPLETGGQLFNRLAPMGADLLVKTIEPYARGEIEPTPQADQDATYAPMLKKADGELDFNQSADRLGRQVKAFNPWPSSFFRWRGQRHIVHEASVDAQAAPATPGTTTSLEGLPAISCCTGLLVIRQLQPAGKSKMTGAAFLRGAPTFVGAAVDQAP